MWHNAFGEPVDLDDIDKEYALNILSMVISTRTLRGYTREDFQNDPLVEKLRSVVLNGREKNARDRLRGWCYNWRCRRAGLPYRAS